MKFKSWLAALLLSCSPTNAADVQICGPGATSCYPSTYSSPSAEASHVLKATPGVLFGVYLSNPNASGFLMIFNSTTVPGDGAVTPLECVPVSASNVAYVNYLSGPGEFFSAGISIALSSTGCFTKTTSPTGFFHGLYQ